MAGLTYADSSFLISLISRDSRTADAVGCMVQREEPLLFTPLHRIEVRNALRNLAARGAIDPSEQKVAFSRIDEDLREGLLVHHPVTWTDAFRRADELSEKYAAVSGQRTIDLLHVAIALESGATVFLSFDQRQRKLAAAAGFSEAP